ncbi:conserved nucleotide-related metabolism protein [Candidatus Hydrogenisulfobacillus filiaventi]|uniref:Conserved nucleotide-related metabolism protein n=1 Tax=Candidatus Hydrogenisulfobacillus filiaventi TaxID=2707344 RepID=A0A6F8ZJP9_9FIRM|nr:conserved nucleotide-related metabolism protein [Candidatus Hydrogenisulfobacillus filiaventi]
MRGGIKALPAADRPRERLLRLGPEALADHELLAVLLGSGTAGHPVHVIAERLLAEGWAALARRRPQELLGVEGLGPAKAALLAAALDIGRRVRQAVPAPPEVRTPEDVVRLVDDMAFLDQEEFRVISLNTKHRVLAAEVVFRGGLDTVEVFPRELFRRAVGRSAAAVVVVHNHPSGDPLPSPEDLALTRRLVLAGRVLGIPVLDHIVVAAGGHVSVRRFAPGEAGDWD